MSSGSAEAAFRRLVVGRATRGLAMRWKIIVVNAGILVVVGLLAYMLLYTSLRELVANPGERKRDVERGLGAARSELALDAFRIERWLSDAAQSESVKGLFTTGLRNTRADAATAEANRLRAAAGERPELANAFPTLVLFVDEQGVALGRNASNLMRGENIGAVYPSLMDALRGGKPASAVWHSRERQERLLATVVPIVEGPRTLGAVVVGTALSDERLTRVSELTSGQLLVLARVSDAGLEPLAVSNTSEAGAAAALTGGPMAAAAKSSLGSGRFAPAELADADLIAGSVPLLGYGGEGLVLIGASPSAAIHPSALLTPLFGVVALGLLLVVIGGFLLGNYISEPISELEDGLLAIINGQSGLRFQIEHDELGGLVFRINSLLNAWMGVPEDNTDDQGRPSQGPRAQDFQDALSVDESAVAEQTDPGVSVRLAAESADSYYERLFREYIAARRELGDPVDHITAESFRERIRENEREMAEKHGRPVRFEVQLRNRAIILNAIPLGSSEAGSEAATR